MNTKARPAVRIVLTLVVLGGIVATAALLRPRGSVATATGTGADRVATVVVTPATTREFESALRVSGNLEPSTFAVVSARIGGVLDAILVDEGDPVVAKKTVLFRTDSLKLAKALEIASQGEAVAAAALREREAYLEQIQADHHQAELDRERFRKLVEKGAATARQLEQQESRFAQVTAGIKHARALVDLARTQAEQATLTTAIAKKDLDDATVLAPLSGRVTLRHREPGEDVGAGKPVLRIENQASLEVCVFLPEEAYDRVRVGETTLRVRVGANDLGEIPVTWRSPTVDVRLRTFEVKATFSPGDDDIVPGRLVEVVVPLTSRSGLGVPAAAVLHRRQGPCVFVVRDGVARLLAISPGLETDGWIEVEGDGLDAGAAVVTTGQTYLDDGEAVRIVEEER